MADEAPTCARELSGLLATSNERGEGEGSTGKTSGVPVLLAACPCHGGCPAHLLLRKRASRVAAHICPPASAATKVPRRLLR
jgi:hypothetical protein